MSEILAIKMHQCYATEISISGDGYLVIDQADPGGGDSQFVLLSPDQASRLIEFAAQSHEYRFKKFNFLDKAVEA